jgi:hypothetical protein
MEEEDEPVSRSPTEREAGGVQWQRRAVWLTPTPTPTLPLPVLVRCLVGILRLRRWLIWAGGRGGISRRKQPPRQGANASEMVLHSPSLSLLVPVCASWLQRHLMGWPRLVALLTTTEVLY